MAKICDDAVAMDKTVAQAGDYLAAALPDDYLLVPHVRLAALRRAPAIDLAVIGPAGVIAVTMRDWAGPIGGSATAETLQVGPAQEPQANPIPPARRQAQRLAAFLRQPEQAAAFLDDARACFGLSVAAAVLFTHPDAHLAIAGSDTAPDAGPGAVRLLRLDETAVAQLQGAAFGRRGFALHPHERERLARLLRRADGATAAEDAAETQPAQAAARPQRRPEPPAPAVLRPVVAPGASRDARETTQRTQVTRRALPDDATQPRFLHIPDRAQPPAPARQRMVGAVRQGLSWFGGLLDGFERRAEQLVEPGAQPAGGRNIDQPRLAQLLEQELEQNLQYMMNRIVAHNAYTVLLSPADYAQYEPLRALGEEELTNYLQQVVAARDYTLPGALEVTVAAAPELAPGRVRVHSRIVAGRSGPAAAELQLDGEATACKLTLHTTGIGRSRENALCVAQADLRQIVSRRHARVVREGERFVLYDGDGIQPSMWGTFVNGEPLNGAGRALQHGDVIVLGRAQRASGVVEGVRLVFRQPQGQASPAA